MRTWRILVALLLAAGAAVATERLPDGGVLVAPPLQVPGLDARVAGIDAALMRDDATRAIALLEGIDDVLLREATAATVLDRLQRQQRPAPDAVLDTIAAWPVQVYRQHDETAAAWYLPVFDLPAKVASFRQVRDRALAVDALRRALDAKSGAGDALAQAEPQVAALAVLDASDAAIARIDLRPKQGAAPLASPVLAALAQRRGDAASLLLALDAAQPLDVLPLFASTVPQLADADLDAVLDAALQRSDYASAAAIALVEAPRTPARDARIATLLRQPDHGASVAAALARQSDALDRIEALLAGASDATSTTHLVLALRLHGGGQQQLHALRDDPRLPAHVRAELQR